MCSLPSHWPLQRGASLANWHYWDPRTIPFFLLEATDWDCTNTPLGKQTPQKYICVCVVGNPPTDSNPIPPILNTHFLAPLSHLCKKPPLKSNGEYCCQFCLGRLCPFQEETRRKQTQRNENEIGMSKRKNEVVFTFIDSRRHPKTKSSASFSGPPSFPLVVGKAPCLSHMCYIPHEEWVEVSTKSRFCTTNKYK